MNIDLNSLQVWFITGSQDLYGEETLYEVALHAEEISDYLSAHEDIPVKVIYKPVVKNCNEIYNIIMEANYTKECIGIITWMHTFSSAKMWIRGLKALQKPLLHLHTQYNRDIPWETMDMDFMNLNQSAHGDREFGHIVTRLNIARKVITGYWKDKEVTNGIKVWIRAAMAWDDWQGAKFVRFGDNMRNVAVTDGDKVEAETKFGFSVNTYPVGDLVAVINDTREGELQALLNEYEETYELAANVIKGGEYYQNLVEAAKIEIGLRKFLETGNFKGFTNTFEDLYGTFQL